MSYILEALKKSEKEREKETVPDLRADHSRAVEKRRDRRRPVLRLLIPVLLLAASAAGLAWWFFSPSQEAEPGREGERAPVSAATVQTPEAPPPSQEAAQLPSEVKEQIVREVNEAVARVVAPQAAPPAPETSGEAKGSVPLLADLPASMQREIPDLDFAGHVYGEDAQKRMIIINGRIVREGDLVERDLSLEEISANGVVLRFKGTVFRVELF
ncbi:MAG: general secretion pathway protein GspB [Thermodesulfobacteriota bacterium]